jgi:hypothetical protein
MTTGKPRMVNNRTGRAQACRSAPPAPTAFGDEGMSHRMGCE